MYSGIYFLPWGVWSRCIILLLGFALQLLDGETPRRLWDAFNRLPPLVQGLLAALILTIVFGLGPAGVAPVIYFQF